MGVRLLAFTAAAGASDAVLARLDALGAENRAMAELLRSLDLEDKYAVLFAENEIDINAIPCLQREDWRDLGVPIGHKSRIVSRVRELHPEVFS